MDIKIGGKFWFNNILGFYERNLGSLRMNVSCLALLCKLAVCTCTYRVLWYERNSIVTYQLKALVI